jgi:phage terminase large subunit
MVALTLYSSLSMKEVEIKYTKVFEWNLEAYQSKSFRVIANQGSTRSGKTYSLSQLLALYIPHKEKVTISVVSPSLPHLKRGARRDILQILEDAGIYSDEAFNKTDNVYHYPNGSYIEFFGAEDSGKVRGPGRDILYINEANLLPFSIYQQLALRTKQTIFLDFNPVDEASWVYDVADKEGNKLIHSTYKNNPFLPKEQVAEIESLKDADENLWKVFGLGERGKSTEIIYTHWKLSQFPDDCEVCYGLDFGYSVPTALVKIGFKENQTFAKEMLYETKLTTTDLIERLKVMDIQRADEIFCDNAEPKTIEELTRAGFNAKPADKDVYAGIQKVKSQPLNITQDSTNLIKEIKSYKWKTDKDGKVHPDESPVKINDHICDAMRYAVFTKLNKPSFQIMAW